MKNGHATAISTVTRYTGLSVAFTLLPEFSSTRPYVLINGHGLAMWFTTPALALLLWPHEKGPLHRALWLTVAVDED